MKNVSREKIALIVFLVLAIAAGFVLFGYIFAGHSWNIAASNLDDTFGNMDGYTVIAYEGTAEGEQAEEQETEPEGDAAAAPLAGHKKETPAVELSEVESAYLDKGASILLLDTLNPSAYSEGTILKRGGKRYGIFSIGGETSRILVDEKVKYLTSQSVDYVVAILPDADLLKSAEGIDIVISTHDPDASTMGEAANGSFRVATPEKGSVGAILISPSNVVSAKTISGQ